MRFFSRVVGGKRLRGIKVRFDSYLSLLMSLSIAVESSGGSGFVESSLWQEAKHSRPGARM